MQSLEAACEESEHMCKKLKTERSSLPLPCPQDTEAAATSDSSSPTSNYIPPYCIFNKLLELYEEECANDPNKLKTGLKRNTLLLDKLVVKERLNTLILNLYPGNKGYSLMFREKSRSEDKDDTATMIEIKDLLYEEELLLTYIDNEELPPFLSETLEPNHSFLFYSGCVIAEVRDYRQAYPAKCDIHYVLLKPSAQSVITDVANVLEDKNDWTSDEKLHLESEILMANAPDLCLSPEPKLTQVETKLNHNRQIWNTHCLRKVARQYFSVTVNHKRKLDQCTQIHGLELYNFMQREKKKDKTKKSPEEITAISVPNLDPPLLSPPTGGVHIPQFKAYQKPKETSDCLPQLIEEYILETDIPLKEGKKRLYHIKLSILQRPSNSEYLGELYLEWDHKQNEQNGVACRFSLGSKAHANQYIQQFTDIFTENGRKRVKIKYRLGPKVAATQMHSAQLQSSLISQVNLAQQHLTQLGQNNANIAPLINGTLGLNLAQQNRASSSVPLLQAQLQARPMNQQLSSKEIEINALANNLRTSAQQFQEKQEEQQRLVDICSSINVETNTSNNTTIIPHVALNQKLLARKMTLTNVNSARVLNHSNLLAVNNNRMTVMDFSSQQQGQTITLNPNFAAQTSSFTLKQPVNRSEKSALSALLVGTPAADRPDIINTNPSSLLLDKLAASSTNSNAHARTVTSPGAHAHFIQSPTKLLSSPPPPQPANMINVQSLNFAPLQNISGLQNVQVQLPGFSQPISLSLNVSSTGALQGHPASLLVSMPVTTATCTTVTQQTANSSGAVVTAGSTIGVGTPTVVLGGAGSPSLAQLVTSGVKGLNQQGLRATSPTGVTLSQGGQSFQLITPVQRPRVQQANLQQNVTARAAVASQLQKQVQLQQYQQLYHLNQQQKTMATNSPAKVRRRSNAAEPQ